jgi:hypothetical protein
LEQVFKGFRLFEEVAHWSVYMQNKGPSLQERQLLIIRPMEKGTDGVEAWGEIDAKWQTAVVRRNLVD